MDKEFQRGLGDIKFNKKLDFQCSQSKGTQRNRIYFSSKNFNGSKNKLMKYLTMLTLLIMGIRMHFMILWDQNLRQF